MFIIDETSANWVNRFEDAVLDGALGRDSDYPKLFTNELNRCTSPDASTVFTIATASLYNLRADVFTPVMVDAYFSMMNVAASKLRIRNDERMRDVFFSLGSMPILWNEGNGPSMRGNQDIVKTQARLYFPLKRSGEYSSALSTFYKRQTAEYNSEWVANYGTEKAKLNFFEEYVLVIVDIKWRSVVVFGVGRHEGVFLMNRAVDWTQRLMESNKASFHTMVSICD